MSPEKINRAQAVQPDQVAHGPVKDRNTQPRPALHVVPEHIVDQLFIPEVEDYELTVAALGHLGLTAAKGHWIPAYEELLDEVNTQPQTAHFLAEQTAQGFRPALSRQIPGHGGVPLEELVAPFAQGKQRPYISKKTWEPYRRGSHSDGLHGSYWTFELTGPSLMDLAEQQPRAELAHLRDSAPLPPQPGLVYLGKNVLQQRRALQTESARLLKDHGVRMQHVTPFSYLVRQAKRQLSGVNYLDQLLETVFPNCQQRGGVVPSIHARHDMPYLVDARVTTGWPDRGVRRAVVV